MADSTHSTLLPETGNTTDDQAYRWLFTELLDPEAKHFSLPLDLSLRHEQAGADHDVGANQDAGDGFLDQLEHDASAWAAAETERYRVVLDQSADTSGRNALVRRVLLDCAPFALVSGAWLQWGCSPVNVDTEIGMRLLSLYATDVGVGHVAASRGHAYLNLLRREDLAEQAIPTARLALDRQLSDRVFRLPVLVLFMSRDPDEFLPELLAADLCLRAVGMLPAIAALRPLITASAEWEALDAGGAGQAADDSAQARSRSLIRLHLTENPGDRTKVAAGFRWMLQNLRDWSAHILDDVTTVLDPAHEMAELLRFKAREGAVYHQRYELAGRPLNEWFELAAAGGDFAPLLQALATSRLIRPGDPDRSPLVNGLVGEHGPMFRIFTPENLAVIRRWIACLPTAADAAVAGAVKAASDRPRTRSAASHAGSHAEAGSRVAAGSESEPADIREAFYLLTRRKDAPGLRRWALRYVRQWLARSSWQLPDADHVPPRDWDPESLNLWIHDQHERQAKEFDATGEYLVPPREELIDRIVQGGLRALIDGAWLQGFTDYEHASSDVGRLLFQIYWDELGNGDLPINHTVLYRELLEDMGINLPHVATREFAQWPGFREMSFEVPVYWLTISRFPRTFLPETLGLNLSEELFGVGGSLRQTQLNLKRHGYNTLFYDIHNTIDNVASGHSAWAIDAINTYMSTVARTFGADVQAETWQRIRTGFYSATPPYYVNGLIAGSSAAVNGTPS
jgi:hypothetical protein